MGGQKIQNSSQLKWREEILNLRRRIKERSLTADEAWELAEEIREEYLADSVRPTTDILNAHLQLCQSLDEAKSMLKTFGPSVRPDTTTYNIQISLAEYLDEAQVVFDVMRSAGLMPNTYTLNGFLPFYHTVAEGRETMKMMNKYRVSPNTQTYNALISMASGATEAAILKAEMEEREIPVNAVTYNSMIVVADYFGEAVNMFEEMKADGIRPTINTLVTLLKKASTSAETDEVEYLRVQEGLSPNRAWRRYYYR